MKKECGVYTEGVAVAVVVSDLFTRLDAVLQPKVFLLLKSTLHAVWHREAESRHTQ